VSNTDLRASLTVTADASALVAEMRKGSEGLREIRREAEAAAKSAAFAASEQGRMAEKLGRTFSGFGAGQKSAHDSAGVFEANHEYEAFQREQAEQAARAYRSIEESLNPLIRAERELAEAQAVVNRALAAGQTTNTAAARSLQQLQARYDGFVRAHSPAAQSAKAFEAALEAEAAEIRQLTYALDPAARAAAEFARVQELVSRSIASQNITTAEGARLLELYTQRQKGATAAGNSPFHTANVAAQGFDIGVTAAMGMNPMTIGLQQGTQLVQVMQQMGGGKQALAGIASGFLSILSPMTLATVGIVAFGALAIQSLAKILPETKSTEEVLGELADSVSRVKDATTEARRSMIDLGKEFGSAAGDAKKLLDLMSEVELRTATKKTDAALANIYSELGGAWNYSGGRRDYLQRMLGERSLTGRLMATPENSPQTFRVDAALEDLDKAREADDLEGQITAATKLLEVFDAAAKASGKVTEEENTWLRQLGELVPALQRIKALKENAAGKTEAGQIAGDLARQVELERVSLKFGRESAQTRAVENRHEREALELKLETLGLNRQQEEWSRAMGALSDLQHQRELAVMETRREWFRDQDDRIAAIQRETSLIGSSAAEQIRINTLAEAEVDIRKRKLGVIEAVLVRMRAIATAEAETARARERAMKDLADAQTAETFDAAIASSRNPYARAELEAQREYARQIADGADADVAAGHAALVRARALRELRLSQDEYLRGQRERLQQLKLEQALLGQSEAVRSRILALWKAELEIRRQGIDAASERAQEIRAAAVEEDALTRSVERQKEAWSSVQSAAESAIDGIIDSLMKGDIEGAFEALASDISGMFAQLAISNPMKNAILGTDHATMADVGGLEGIWARLTGRGDGSDIQLPGPVTDVGTMSVEAASVVIGGPGAMSLLAGSNAGAANANFAPGIGGGLSGSSDVQSQVWQFFAAKGLQPHQIASIMGHMSAESGFDPTIPGDNGNAVGLFQHNGPRMRGLLNAIGGRGNLTDVQAQLEFAWKEMNASGTLENRAFQQLMASPDLLSGVRGFAGFERPKGFSWGNPDGSHNFDGRMAAAEAALTKFGTTAETTTADLGTLGGGMGAFGNALQGFAQGGPQGALNGLLGGIGQIVASAIGIPGFAFGGDFGGGVRIVGEKGPELEFTGPSRIMNAELTRQLLSSRNPAMAANTPAQPVVQIQPVLVNNTSRPFEVETEETTDARGQRQTKYVLSEMTSQGIGARGGAAARTLRGMGVGTPTRRRG